jgi:hypothetical protein
LHVFEPLSEALDLRGRQQIIPPPSSNPKGPRVRTLNSKRPADWQAYFCLLDDFGDDA